MFLRGHLQLAIEGTLVSWVSAVLLTTKAQIPVLEFCKKLSLAKSVLDDTFPGVRIYFTLEKGPVR